MMNVHGASVTAPSCKMSLPLVLTARHTPSPLSLHSSIKDCEPNGNLTSPITQSPGLSLQFKVRSHKSL